MAAEGRPLCSEYRGTFAFHKASYALHPHLPADALPVVMAIHECSRDVAVQNLQVADLTTWELGAMWYRETLWLNYSPIRGGKA